MLVKSLKIFFLLIPFVCASSVFAYATSTATTSDELCATSDGRKIPCEFLSAAENDSKQIQSFTSTKTNTSFCLTADGGRYIPCSNLKNGKPDTLYTFIDFINTYQKYVLTFCLILVTFSIFLIIKTVINKLKK